ncbi:MAG: AMP-binding protein [Dehalococcoidales bacterium]|nr:AMP-binding protein [Dehalococcoidales bacterium]
MNISDMLTRNGRVFSEDIALIEPKSGINSRTAINWREFDEKANRFANALRDRGVSKGDKVIHWMMNSTDWLIAYFGIIRTGAWAVPLNFRFRSQDAEYCAEIAEAGVMVLGEEFIERVEAARTRMPLIKDYILAGQNPSGGMESFQDMIDKSPAQPSGVELALEDCAALYFTSGTTGRPKPILITHRNMESAAVSEVLFHYQRPEDNFIIIPPLYHTGVKMHWFGSLMTGGRATLLSEFSPERLFETVQQERGSIVWIPTAWTYDILAAMDRGELKKADYDLSSWRLMHMGAGPIPTNLVKRWKEYFPDMQYNTTYGLSETTGPCIRLGIENESRTDSVGRPGLDWDARIVDDNGQDVARGEVGEIILKGSGVMKEYYGNPEKTAETLKDGWLYTGDVARMDEDSFIYIIDRKKDVVISGGENIYPVEVENVLRNHAKIRDVAVIGITDGRLGEIVAAVIDPRPDLTLTAEEINEFCEQKLARYKRPRRIIFDKIPRNPTGKIEKQKLKDKYAGKEAIE